VGAGGRKLLAVREEPNFQNSVIPVLFALASLNEQLMVILTMIMITAPSENIKIRIPLTTVPLTALSP
jgi:hypothetical protein